MNTRHYAGIFDDASWHLLAKLGYAGPESNGGVGWADARQTMEFKREALQGAVLRVDSRVAILGISSMILRHRLVDVRDGELIATFESVSVCFDLVARKSRPVPDDIRKVARDLFGIAQGRAAARRARGILSAFDSRVSCEQ
jgi:acyl-CoA thioester hydrolase